MNGKSANLKEILRFAVAGSLVGATDFGIYHLLSKITFFSVAKAISFVIAGIIAYGVNKYFTFKDKQPACLAEIVRYILVNVLALEINVLINQSILFWWPNVLIFAFIIASLSTGLVTFIGFKWWVFKFNRVFQP